MVWGLRAQRHRVPCSGFEGIWGSGLWGLRLRVLLARIVALLTDFRGLGA